MGASPGQSIAVAGWHGGGGGGGGHCGHCDSCRPEGGGWDFVICVNPQVPGIPCCGVYADYIVVFSAALAFIADGNSEATDMGF